MKNAKKGTHPSMASDRHELSASGTVIGVVVALAVFVYLVRDILLPFVFAGIIAYVCTPLVDWLTERMRWPRWVFATLVLLALAGVTALAVFLVWEPLSHEISRIAGDLKGTVEALVRQFIGDKSFTLLGTSVDAAEVASSVADGARDWFNAEGRMSDLLAYGSAGMIGVILSWVLLGFCLIDAPNISKGLFWLVPPHHRPFIRRVWDDLDPMLHRYFIGIALIVAYAIAFAAIGLGLVLHLPHAIMLAVFTGLLEVIPIFGPYAAATLVGLVAVTHATSAWDIVAYVIYAVLLRISIDEFYAPIVLGKAASIRPVMVIFCFLAGGILFGLVGIVLAVPVALAVKISLQELYKQYEV